MFVQRNPQQYHVFGFLLCQGWQSTKSFVQGPCVDSQHGIFSIAQQGGKMILGPAPRFNFTAYKKTYINCPGASPTSSHLQGRLQEYQGLYGGKPAESWWGWKFYDIPKEEGEWKRKLSKAELRMLKQERKRKKKKERRKREEKEN